MVVGRGVVCGLFLPPPPPPGAPPPPPPPPPSRGPPPPPPGRPRRNVLPGAKTVIKDGDHTAPYPVYSELFHGWVGLASGIQNFDGNGHAVRYHAGFGDQTITTGQVSGLTEPLVALPESKILGAR